MENICHIQIPRPTSEEECAKVARYNFMDHDDIPEDLQREQQEHINKLEEGTQGPLRRCGETNEQYCCYDEKNCINKRYFRACPDDCHEGCQNNPWGRRRFCIEQGKTYLSWDPVKKYGLFAHTVIRKGEFIGQYTGKLTRSSMRMTKVQKSYAMRLSGCNQILDASESGSACRLINHSCNPNCEAFEMTHAREFKIVIAAVKDIKEGQEITINYGWKFRRDEENVVCLCGEKDCSGLIGSIMEEYYEDQGLPMPNTFRGTFKENTRLSDIVLCSPPLYQEQNLPDLTESHVFGCSEKVYTVVVEEDDSFSIVPHVVVQCHRNDSGFYFYLVRRPISEPPGYKEICIPMWLAFKNKIVANHYVSQVFSVDDKSNIVRYFKCIPSVRTANRQLYEVVADYVNLHLAQSLPKLNWQKKFNEGAAAIGAPSFYLVPKLDEPVQSQTTNPENRPHTNKKGTVNVYQQADVVKNPVTHSEMLRRIINENTNYALMTRLFQSSLEKLTFLVMARSTDEPKFLAVYHQLTQELKKFYYNKDAKRRVYLEFVHYQVAMDLYRPGSLSSMICSLCGPDFPKLENEENLKEHYLMHHAICAKSYQCSSCESFQTRFPSEFRSHLATCAPQALQHFAKDFNPTIADSYADYIALKTETGSPLCLIKPGLPLPYVLNENRVTCKNAPSTFELNDQDYVVWDGHTGNNVTDTDSLDKDHASDAISNAQFVVDLDSDSHETSAIQPLESTPISYNHKPSSSNSFVSKLSRKTKRRKIELSQIHHENSPKRNTTILNSYSDSQREASFPSMAGSDCVESNNKSSSYISTREDSGLNENIENETRRGKVDIFFVLKVWGIVECKDSFTEIIHDINDSKIEFLDDLLVHLSGSQSFANNQVFLQFLMTTPQQYIGLFPVVVLTLDYCLNSTVSNLLALINTCSTNIEIGIQLESTRPVFEHVAIFLIQRFLRINKNCLQPINVIPDHLMSKISYNYLKPPGTTSDKNVYNMCEMLCVTSIRNLAVQHLCRDIQDNTSYLLDEGVAISRKISHANTILDTVFYKYNSESSISVYQLLCIRMLKREQWTVPYFYANINNGKKIAVHLHSEVVSETDLRVIKDLLYKPYSEIEDQLNFKISFAVYEIAKVLKIANIWSFLFRDMPASQVIEKQDKTVILKLGIDLEKHDVVVILKSTFKAK